LLGRGQDTQSEEAEAVATIDLRCQQSKELAELLLIVQGEPGLGMSQDALIEQQMRGTLGL